MNEGRVQYHVNDSCIFGWTGVGESRLSNKIQAGWIDALIGW